MVSAANVIWACMKASFYIYGFWLYSSEIVCCAVPTAGIGALLLFILVHIGKLPAPDPATVEEILGQDPLLQERDDSKKDSEEAIYIMRSIAHRGAALDAPENSISAFRQAKEKGMTAVEFDVTLTKDNVPIVFHDDTVDRMTEATGRINSMTWEEVKQLDISEKHPMRHKYGGERIPLFEDVVKECLDLGLRMFIDLKGDDLKMVSVVHNAYKNHKEMYTRAIVSSFNPFLIYMVRLQDPRITCMLAWRPHRFATLFYNGTNGDGQYRYDDPVRHYVARSVDLLDEWALHNFYHHFLGTSLVGLLRDTISQEVVRLWKERGLRVMPWTVNLPLEKQYFSRILKVGPADAYTKPIELKSVRTCCTSLRLKVTSFWAASSLEMSIVSPV
ncbi:glycerophosphodiester phosphodiesterase 1 isoform X2 [Cryptotermes secundus]|uniref:glycerophosphodiester phosphodiesterase 1 isoform X2 n=1 Tax=Cryptotermes secundus TaxID=105785 RepID=UPI000CD7ABC9|nr:glycerophosphodiester phosphodiesterase 1 isoform X2 [Cryptotermes secundus]